MNKKYINQDGFVAFTSLLVISTIVFFIAISVPILGITEANNSLSYARSSAAFRMAESCNDEALFRLRDDANYSGGSLTFNSGNCTISVSGAGSNKTIDVVASLSEPPNFVRRTQMTVKRTGNSINILTWQEI